MKKRQDVDALAAQLTTAAATPLQKQREMPDLVPTTKKTKAIMLPVYLRLPEALHTHYDNLAMQRTKESGRGVSIQQVIIEQLEQGL